MKRIHIEEVKTIEGHPFKVPPEQEQEIKPGEKPKMEETTDLLRLLKLLVFNIPRPKVTMKDSINAADLFAAMRKAEENGAQKLELNEGTHDWLKKVIDDYGTAIYGLNAVALKDALDNFDRAYPKSEKGA